MITLLKDCSLFCPEPTGEKDLLILGNRIGAISEPGKIRMEGVEITVIDASGKTALPGFVDSHVHILGGGGEGGPTTRAPEITLEDIIQSGVTTVIGCLGTDGITRHMESLLAKARSLEEEGITTFIFAGSYEVPAKTITGSIRSDLVLIDKIVGAGEIAISDHRSSQPTFEEIARLAAECRVGGMLGGKAGVLHLHLGDGPRGLEMLFRLIKETEIPATQVIPTHVNRNRQLLEEAMEFARQGGAFDLTAGTEPEDEERGEVSVEEAIKSCLAENVPLSRITVSSDSNGSLPVFDPKGNLIGLSIATQKSLLRTFRHLVQKKVLSLDKAAALFSVNPATLYKLKGKGKIQAGQDADLILLDNKLDLTHVFSQGRLMMAEGELVVRGTFRSSP